ncbi:RNA polymerase I-specific transcription initiation factor RRN3 [Mycena floridula]|nr:RNA polymerase I-specific transcription initiation factor RRN3 [Mycena floridula]
MDPHSRLVQYNQRVPKSGPKATARFMDPPAAKPSPLSGMKKPSANASASSLLVHRPIATNSRVKQEQKFHKDMHLAFIENALQQKTRGVSDSFNELVNVFNPSSGSAPQPSELRIWILALSHVVSRLERAHAALVKAIVDLSWTTMDSATVKSYTVFIGMLLSAKPEYLAIVLGKIAQGFTHQAGLQAMDNTLPEGSSSPLTRRTVYDRLHYLLRHVISLIPTLPSTLMPLLTTNFPHKRQNQASQSTYIRNLLRVSEYCPELADKILATIVDRAIQIDVEIQVELDDLEEEDPDAVDEHELFELDPFDTLVGQEIGEDSESDNESIDDDFSDISSDGGDMSDNEKREVQVPMNVQHIQDMVKKLDIILTLVFDHFRRIHDSVVGVTATESALSLPDLPPLPPLTPMMTPLTPLSHFSGYFPSPSLPDISSNAQQSLPAPLPPPKRNDARVLRDQFHSLLSIFDRTILPTFKSRYTQFLIFWYTSLDPEFCDTFQGMLVDTALFQPNSPVVIRAAAATYIGSFVSRASFVDRESVRRVTSVLCEFLKSHLDDVDGLLLTKGSKIELSNFNQGQNTVFYAVTRAMFLVFCFRWRDLMEDGGDDLGPHDTKTGKKWMRELDVMQRVVNSVFNPLKVCGRDVSRMFARVAQATDFIYCYTVLESNQRAEHNDSRPTGKLSVALLGDKIMEELNTFFPFDPCKLPKVNGYIDTVFRDWQSVKIGDSDDEDSEEEDGEMMEEDIEGIVITRASSRSDDEANLIGASLGAMSISPAAMVLGSMNK